MTTRLLILTLILVVALVPRARPASAQTGAAPESGAGGEVGAARAAGGGVTPRAQAGDRVVLRIWNEPEMSDTFTVARTGEVILPRLGATQVAGVEIEALQGSLRTAYAEFLRNPSVEVVVLRRISVLGEVRNPGIYMADLTMGIPELIAQAGGVLNTADPNRVTLMRGSERVEFDRRRQAEMFVAELHSGDQIHVPQRGYLVRNAMPLFSTGLALLTTILFAVR